MLINLFPRCFININININMYFAEVAEKKIYHFWKPALDIHVKLAELRSHCTLAYTPVFFGKFEYQFRDKDTDDLSNVHKSGIFSLHGHLNLRLPSLYINVCNVFCLFVM